MVSAPAHSTLLREPPAPLQERSGRAALAAGSEPRAETGIGAPRGRQGPAGALASASSSGLADWFTAHVDLLWRIVSRLGVPAHSVEDVLQEVFLTANRRRGDIVAGQERAFLTAVALRLCANYRRRGHVQREVRNTEWVEQAAALEPSAEELLSERRRHAWLQALVLGLPELQREVFVLYELEDFSAPEIAALLGVPLGTVASRLARGRASFEVAAQALKERLAADTRSSK